VARKVFLAMLEGAGFIEGRCAGTGEYRTSPYTQAAYYTARKSGAPWRGQGASRGQELGS
jgi:hypothetical protein